MQNWKDKGLKSLETREWIGNKHNKSKKGRQVKLEDLVILKYSSME